MKNGKSVIENTRRFEILNFVSSVELLNTSSAENQRVIPSGTFSRWPSQVFHYGVLENFVTYPGSAREEARFYVFENPKLFLFLFGGGSIEGGDPRICRRRNGLLRLIPRPGRLFLLQTEAPPPSTTTSSPCMYEALSEARNVTTSATSSGSAKRFRGTSPAISFFIPSRSSSGRSNFS